MTMAHGPPLHITYVNYDFQWLSPTLQLRCRLPMLALYNTGFATAHPHALAQCCEPRPLLVGEAALMVGMLVVIAQNL